MSVGACERDIRSRRRRRLPRWAGATVPGVCKLLILMVLPLGDLYELV